MASVNDVAQYILSKTGQISTWKLQKLVYYSQAWSLVFDEKPLFDERIEAWANGPVCPSLYECHRGSFYITKIRGGTPGNLDDDARETIDKVIEFYGGFSGQKLSDLTHMESPWKNARGDLSPSDRGSNEITLESMAEYYGSL